MLHKPFTRQEVARFNADAIAREDHKRKNPPKTRGVVKGCKCMVCGEWLWTPTDAHANKHGYDTIGEMVDCGVAIIKG